MSCAAMIIFGGPGDDGEPTEGVEARASVLPLPGGAAVSFGMTF